MKEKVILAYSGGLDTTAIIPWLKETYNYDVVCVCADCGQEEELDGLEQRALSCGAAKLYIEDITDEFCDNYIVPCVQAHAVYENKYLLGTSMARPLIAKRLVEIARKEGAVAICHGATGKGNDQIRFELTIKALAPDIKIIAPWRDSNWKLQSREDEIEYCRHAFLGGQCCTRVCRDLYRYAYRRREHDIYRAVRGRRKRKVSHSWREARERSRGMDCPCIAPLWLGRARRRRLGAAHTPHSKPQERAIIKTLQESSVQRFFMQIEF